MSRNWLRRDHPRSRGVYALDFADDLFPDGSSPLARGLHDADVVAHAVVGIIPARAGFTLPPLPQWPRSQDHPRSRGVYAFDGSFILDHLGSSPLARGLPPDTVRLCPNHRIIPARAGFTLADPWNPNDEPCYQTAFTFSADLEPAPPSSGSAVVLRRSTMTPSEA